MRSIMMLAFALMVAGFARAQGPADPDTEKIQKLVQSIQKQMRDIDQLLLRSDNPQEAAKKIDATIKSIQDLLKAADTRQSAVVKDLEELVRLAKYQKSQSSSQPPPPDKNQKNQQSEGEQRPKDQQPDELQKQPQQPKEQDQPQGGKEDSTQAQQKPAQRTPPQGEKGQFQRTDVSERWGVLPAKEQEDLINALTGKLPERYRRWIDEYYRRMNKAKR